MMGGMSLRFVSLFGDPAFGEILNEVLELFTWFEFWEVCFWDFDFFSCSWVTSCGCVAFGDVECSEPEESDFFTGFE